MITVLAFYERISVFHTMEPFLSRRFRKLFKFTQSPSYCLEKDKNRILFMERFFKNDQKPDLELMKALRDKYEKVFFFDGYASAGTHLLELLPYVDRLYHKSVFTDMENYKKPLFSKRLFADYYHTEYKLEDEDPEYIQDFVPADADLSKLKLSWNIGLGDYPRRHTPQRIGVAAARILNSPGAGRIFRTGTSIQPEDFSGMKRTADVHARVGLVKNTSVAYHRKVYLDQIADNSVFLTGSVPQKQFYRELYSTKIVFSPFGWGEVCFRDFEAVVAGAMLLKPDMSHLKTWPDIYIPYETYVPVDWDGKDFMDKVGEYLGNDSLRKRIARNAWEKYRSDLAETDNRMEIILQEAKVL